MTKKGDQTAGIARLQWHMSCLGDENSHCSWGSVAKALHEDPHMLDVADTGFLLNTGKQLILEITAKTLGEGRKKSKVSKTSK